MITIYSIVTTMFVTSILCLLLYLASRSMLFKKYFGVQSLFILVVCCVIRLFIPIEFTFSKVILVPQLLNPLKAFFYQTFSVMGFTFTMIWACVFIWITISAILLVGFIHRYIKFSRYLGTLSNLSTPQIDRIAKDIISPEDSGNIRIFVYLPTVVPVIFGLKQSAILLPIIDYTDEELHVIISHEYEHYKRHDNYFQLLVELLAIAFWWNPLVYLVRNECRNVLEMKIDYILLKEKDLAEALQYSETLLKFSENNKVDAPLGIGSEFSYQHSVLHRFAFLLQIENMKKPRRVYRWLFGVAVIIVFLLSYGVVFQSYYSPNECSHSLEICSGMFIE